MTGAGVILVTGAMAAGKSTVAQALAERLPRSAHVRGDAFRRMIVSGRSDMAPPLDAAAEEQLELRHRLAAAAADGYARGGFTAVVQDLYLGEDLARMVGLVSARPLSVVVLAPSAEVLARRDRERGSTGYGTWTAQEFERAVAGTPRLGLWIDTSALTAAETVDRIIADLRIARVA